MGRPRKPVAQHLLDGTYRDDRHGNTWFPDGAPVMPDWLCADAKQLWQSLVPRLAGIATAVDSTELAALCDWFAIYRQTRQALDAVDDRQSTSFYKLLQLTGLAWNNFSGIAAKFGLTPSDRARLHVSQPPDEGGLKGFARSREDRRRNETLDS